MYKIQNLSLSSERIENCCGENNIFTYLHAGKFSGKQLFNFSPCSVIRKAWGKQETLLRKYLVFDNINTEISSLGIILKLRVSS